jgi:hypothetical protein
MDSNSMNDLRIPLICLDPVSVPSFIIFNSNDWVGESKTIVQSCATEYSVLQHGVSRIATMCLSGKELCQPHFDNLEGHWRKQPWDLEKLAYYGQIPELHMLIEAFFSGLKSLLDLIVQLISTEGIVGSRLHGFHRVGATYGGNVLNSLKSNVCTGREQTAQDIRAFIEEQKKLWIDEVISARNQLVHPSRGTHQLMFYIELENQIGNLIYKDAVPPFVGDKRIDVYSAMKVEDVKKFALTFLGKFRASGGTA